MKVGRQVFGQITARFEAGRPYVLGLRYRQLTIIKGRGDSVVLQEMDEARHRTGNELGARVALVIFQSDVDSNDAAEVSVCEPERLATYLTPDEIERRPWLAAGDSIRQTAVTNRLSQILLIADENAPIDFGEDDGARGSADEDEEDA